MNERIEKLGDAADLLGECTPTRIPGRYVGYITVEAIEKFAELIVTECAEVCLAQRDPANLNYKPSERFAEALKQHFGVEQ